MSDPIIVTNDQGVEQQPEKLEFYVYGDNSGIVEIRLANNVPFVLQNFIGIANFIRSQLRNEQGKIPTLPRFLQDLARMCEDSHTGLDTEPVAEEPVEETPGEQPDQQTLQ